MDFLGKKKAKSIEISDKPLFDKYFQKYPPEISELTFTNLFIWRDHYEFLFTEWNEHLLIFSNTYLKKYKPPIFKNKNPVFFLPPMGPEPTEMIFELFSNLKEIEIHRIPESLSDNIKRSDKAKALRIVVLEDRNNWDYIYDKESLVNLPGNKFRQKRRWLTKFLETHKHEFHLLSDEWIESCRKLQIEWCYEKDCISKEDLLEEQKAIYYAINNYKTLNFNGGVIIVEGKCVAYTFGELLNSETIVIHIEKASIKYDGAYQAINNYFCKECCLNAKYINREQDLGDSGLRQAKESYQPHRMGKKSILYRTS